MSFSTDMAELVAGQLNRFVTLNRHQLAGQAANLDFWLGEVRHALAVLDGYGVRFVRMYNAQESNVAANGVTESVPGCDLFVVRTPAPPRRIPDRELNKARRRLIEAANRFLDRCHQDGLITDRELSTARNDLEPEGSPE